MNRIENSSRRSFLRQAFGAGAFVLGARILPTPAFAALETATFSPNVFVGIKKRVLSSSKVTSFAGQKSCTLGKFLRIR